MQPSLPAFSPASFVEARPASHGLQLVALVSLFVDDPGAHVMHACS